jgi:hypothetical protein
MSRLCKTEGCNKPAYEHVSKKTGRRRSYAYCNSYRKHRANAKRRGILFTITLDYFRAWCAETEVLLGAGRSATSLHVDRKIDALGYVEGNLQVLTNSENIAKENRRRKAVRYVEPQHEHEAGTIKTVDITLSPTPDLPF